MDKSNDKIKPLHAIPSPLLKPAAYNILKDRKGYDENFLKIKVPLPQLHKNLQKHIAINNYPGNNGDKVLDYTRFSIVHNKTKKLPFYTAVNIDGDTAVLASLHEPRLNHIWYKDERIKESENLFQFGDKDYISSGFQKGHMVRYYDPAWGNSPALNEQAIDDTFHYTNCCPQLPLYNAGLWNDLEDYYMSRALFQNGRVTVFTGPIFNKAKKINKLLVPINFWKVVVYINPQLQLETVAFIVSHELIFQQMARESLLVEKKMVKPNLDKADIDRLFNDKNLKKWVVKLDLIEKKTKINFNLNNYDLNKEQAPLFHIPITSEGAGARSLTAEALTAEQEDFTEFIKAI